MICQEIDISEAREGLKAAILERDEKARIVREMEGRENGLCSKILAKQEDIAELSARLRKADRDLERRSRQVAELPQAEAARAQETPQIPASVNMTISELEEGIAGHKARHTADANKILRLEGEVDGLRHQLEVLEKARASGAKPRTSAEAAFQKMESMILDLEGQKVESQAEITRLSLQLEALHGAAGDNVEGVLASLKAENNALAEELNRLSAEHDQLRSRFDAISADENRDNRLLRDQITDIAAEVVAMTTALEGEDSKTDRILKEATAANRSDVHALSGDSLADRIRTLRDQTRNEPEPARQRAGAS
ncbi:hypothetical protein [Breoghania sp.]|uniref:hypothetical protein n=1 Tax=Breoghania sp. TaxID=2065378 RepID=UPI002631D71D|nr:hypothetical protein [Breoghania sp.]MDJ0931912.1 hypothetical protein [Breoghania sp.]